MRLCCTAKSTMPTPATSVPSTIVVGVVRRHREGERDDQPDDHERRPHAEQVAEEALARLRLANAVLPDADADRPRSLMRPTIATRDITVIHRPVSTTPRWRMTTALEATVATVPRTSPPSRSRLPRMTVAPASGVSTKWAGGRSGGRARAGASSAGGVDTMWPRLLADPPDAGTPLREGEARA